MEREWQHSGRGEGENPQESPHLEFMGSRVRDKKRGRERKREREGKRERERGREREREKVNKTDWCYLVTPSAFPNSP